MISRENFVVIHDWIGPRLTTNFSQATDFELLYTTSRECELRAVCVIVESTLKSDRVFIEMMSFH